MEHGGAVPPPLVSGSIAGGLTGPDNNTPSFDVDLHNTLFIISHFHAFTVLSITGGGMALAYAFFPILVGRFWYSPVLSRIHFAFTAIGGSGLLLFFDELGNSGILRREVIFPAVGSVPLYQLGLLVSIVVILVGQLFFVLNAVLTVFRGRIVAADRLGFAEVVRAAAQSTYPRPKVPIVERAQPRRSPQAGRERAERTWVGTVLALLIVVIAVTTPATLSTASDISVGSSAPAGAVFVDMEGVQYYWSVTETGPIVGHYDNVIVATAGEWVEINATASGATQGVYIPFRSEPTVDIQVVPGVVSHALFEAPTTPGSTGFRTASSMVLVRSGRGRIDRPSRRRHHHEPHLLRVRRWWRGHLRSAGPTGERGPARGGPGGALRSLGPGPTLTATAGAVGFSWTVPFSSIGIDSYLVNVTSNDPNGQSEWLSAHNDTVPATFGIYAIGPSGLDPISESPLRVGAVVNESASLSAGVYLYGVISPIPYS